MPISTGSEIIQPTLLNRKLTAATQLFPNASSFPPPLKDRIPRKGLTWQMTCLAQRVSWPRSLPAPPKNGRILRLHGVSSSSVNGRSSAILRLRALSSIAPGKISFLFRCREFFLFPCFIISRWKSCMSVYLISFM